MSKDNGGPAFPGKLEQCTFGYELTGGMSLRDYFAAKAMQVFLENPNSEIKADAKNSYVVADAMLEARK